jgi:hypothetical protein
MRKFLKTHTSSSTILYTDINIQALPAVCRKKM